MTTPGIPPRDASAPMRIAVLASGRGTNLQALLDARAAGRLPIEVVLVAGDRAEAPALRRAEAAGVPTVALDPKGFPDRAAFDRRLFEAVAEQAPALVVLAGFMRILSPAVLAPWAGRILNIHPSLLPKYPGLHTHARALAAGDTRHGASVHFVTADLDAGPTLAQAEIPLHPGDTPDAIARRLLGEEHRLLVASVALVASGRVALDGGRVRLDGVALPAPLLLRPDGTLAGA
jgi:phosphoribosylglycinamide formyltransferase-1